MPATLRTCTVCSATFHGRADAAYCSTACRQKAYRKRTRNVTIRPHVTGPVPDGDEWMRDRFSLEFSGAYMPIADRPYTGRSKRIRGAIETEGKGRITGYVETVATIGRDLHVDIGCVTGIDYDTPLGDTLPAQIDPATAADLAARMRASLPRVHELLALLEGRAVEAANPVSVGGSRISS